MGVLIILLFILIIGSCIIMLYPRWTAIRIGGINRYDLQSIPTRYIVWVYVITSIILTASIAGLVFILKDQLYPFPTFVETILEWLHV